MLEDPCELCAHFLFLYTPKSGFCLGDACEFFVGTCWDYDEGALGWDYEGACGVLYTNSIQSESAKEWHILRVKEGESLLSEYLVA